MKVCAMKETLIEQSENALIAYEIQWVYETSFVSTLSLGKNRLILLIL